MMRGYRVRVSYPTDCAHDQRAWRVVIFKDDRKVRDVIIPILIHYSDSAEPDHEDIWNLEAQLDDILAALIEK